MNSTIRRLLFAVVILAIVLAATLGGYRGYKSWKQARMTRLAEEYLKKGDGRNAMLALQQALRANPKYLKANRLMAQMMELAGSERALEWRDRVVRLNPKSTEDRIALAQSALLFRQYIVATNAMEGVSADGRKTASYQTMAGTLALAINQPAEAEQHFLEATRIDPTNLVPRLNLAVLRLRSTNTVTVENARTTLKQISMNPTNAQLRCQAMRELVGDAIRQTNLVSALALCQDLVQQTNSTFKDKLVRLDVLHATTNSDYQPMLAAARAEAATNQAKILDLANWLGPRVGPRETLDWLEDLPPETRTNVPAVRLAAECRLALRDWSGLTRMTNDWSELDFLRRAYRARGLRELDLDGASKAEWSLAVKEANNQRVPLTMLLGLAYQWGWQGEWEEILWTFARQYPEDQWATQQLVLFLYKNGRTRPLLQLFSIRSKLKPADLNIKNDLAMTAMLLGADELKPYDMARDLYEKQSTNAAYASTYAFSLYLQKKNAEALEVMNKLDAKALKQPSIAPYYGLVLQANGETAKAKHYFEVFSTTNAPHLLPEEKKIFANAKAL